MKNQAPELQSAYEDSKRKYEAWKAANGGSVDANPRLSLLQSRVDKATRQLAPYFDS